MSEVHAGRVFFCLVLILMLGACDRSPDETTPEAADAAIEEEETGDQQELADSEPWQVACCLAEEQAAGFGDTMRFSDAIDALNVLFMEAARSRDSEMGHSSFKPEMNDDFMRNRASEWLRLFQAIQANFSRGISVYPHAVMEAGQWQGRGESRLEDHVWGVYLYHMHHRESWFAHHDLDDGIRHLPLGLLTGLSRNVYDGHYQDGRFHADPEGEDFSAASMMQGMAAAHAMNYAWVRWKKPGGEDDMGRLEEERLAGWLGRGPEDLLLKARLIVHELDAAWDESRAFYDFGEDEWSLRTLAAMLRGHKGFYELLYLFGDDADREAARRLFDRSAISVESLMAMARPWGLPARIRFSEDGWLAADERVDVAAHWTLIADLTAGFAYTRERDGTARFLARERPALAEGLAAFVDQQIAGALAYQMPEGLLVSSLDWADGTVVDADVSLRAISRFLLGAGEGYGGSDAFASPSGWEGGDTETATRELYHALLRQGEFARETFMRLPGR